MAQPLGQGGFGRTYLATDEDRLQTPCVIKQFSPNFKDPSSLDKALRLFEEEAKRLFELGEHAQIPALLAYFEHEQQLYLVQQFIEGLTLAQELQMQGCFDEGKVRELLMGILPILQFIHDRQIIHRDITPGNIIRQKTTGKLVLIDFGVAKQITSATDSQAGTKIGTEGYSPIEQWRSGKAYPASDLYSLGATCIYLLTQLRPDVLYDPLTGRWLWRENLMKRGTHISEGLGEILDKMLKDLVNERYQSSTEVLQALQALSVEPAGPSKMAASSSGTTIAGSAATLAKSSASPTVNRPSQPAKIPPTPEPGRVVAPASQPTASGISGSKAGSWSCVQTLTGHSSWITAAAIAPSGDRLASGGLDDKIRLWNYNTGELLHTLKGHQRAVNCLAISPDGQLLASGSDDATIKIWHLPTGNPLFNLVGHTRDVSALAISRDSKVLVSGGGDRTVCLWDLSRGELILTYSEAAGMIKAIALTPDLQLLVTGGLDNKIKLWRLRTGELLRTLPGHFSTVNALAIAPNGNVLASGSKDKTIKLWRLDTGEAIRSITGHTDSVNAVLIHPDGQTLVSGGSDRSLKFWNLRTGSLVYTLTEHTDAIDAIAMSADGQTIASASKDKTIKIWRS